MIPYQGWLTVIGPTTPEHGPDRLLARSLNCNYYTYKETIWICNRCKEFIHSTAFTSHHGFWFHKCDSHTPCRPPLLTDAISTILYSYQPQVARPDVHDDIKKWIMMGKRVVILAHTSMFLHRLTDITGVIGFNSNKIKNLRKRWPTAVCLPQLWHANNEQPPITGKYILGWYGQWRLDSRVHLLIEALSLLPEHIVLSLSGINNVINRYQPSQIAYQQFCRSLINKLQLQQRIIDTTIAHCWISIDQSTGPSVFTPLNRSALITANHAGYDDVATVAVMLSEPIVVDDIASACLQQSQIDFDDTHWILRTFIIPQLYLDTIRSFH